MILLGIGVCVCDVSRSSSVPLANDMHHEVVVVVLMMVVVVVVVVVCRSDAAAISTGG